MRDHEISICPYCPRYGKCPYSPCIMLRTTPVERRKQFAQECYTDVCADEFYASLTEPDGNYDYGFQPIDSFPIDDLPF